MKFTKSILFKLNEFPHLSETFITAQIITAIQLGFEVKIIVEKLLDIDESKQTEILKKFNIIEKLEVIDFKIPTNKFFRVLKWSYLLLKNVKKIKSIYKFHFEFSKFSLSWLYEWNFYNKFDCFNIIHIQYGTNSVGFSKMKKVGFKPKLIVTFHGHDAFFPINGYIPNNNYYKNLFEFGDLITANTKYLSDKIIELGCPLHKVAIIPVGVDTIFFKSSIQKTDNFQNYALKLISVGRLDQVKGHEYCIEVLNVLIKNHKNVTLTIIGEGQQRAKLELLIKKYKIEKSVFLLGKKSQDEVKNILDKHHLYLLLAVALPDGRRETQGLATLEAQAMGLPVVVFDSGGVKYTLENNKTGFYFDEYDLNAVVEKIEYFYNNQTKIQEMGINAVEFVENNFSQKKINEVWKKVYDKFI